MPYGIAITRQARSQLRSFQAREQRIIEEGLKTRLRDHPTRPSLAIKVLRPNPFAAYELRVGDFRVLYNDEDGLESAKPDLQSPFKKPGGGTAEPRLWEMLRDGRAERRLKRGERGRRTAVTDGRGRAQGDGRTSRRWRGRPGNDRKPMRF